MGLLFGKPYEEVGKLTSDLVLKTKGLVKILFGSKFIDLIKDGKLNVDAQFVFKTKDSIGIKDGIYVFDDESVYLKIGDNVIPLSDNEGNSYVSFMLEQIIDSESKYRALTNIGFIYKDLASIDENALLNGIIYVESKLKLYIVKNGNITPFSIELPNPYTEQFVLEKSNSSIGSIFIKGKGISNSLAFENMFIYNEIGNSYIDSNGDIVFKVNDNDKMKITNSSINFLLSLVIGDSFSSNNSTPLSGFRLYNIDDESTLEIDNLILRNDSKYTRNDEHIHPKYWYFSPNVISKLEKYIVEEEGESIVKYLISFKYKITYKEGECLYLYIPLLVEHEETKEEFNYYNLFEARLTVDSIYEQIENTVLASFESTFFLKTLDNYNLVGSTVFSIGNSNSSVRATYLRIQPDRFDLVESKNFDQESNTNSIISRLGFLLELNLKINLDKNEELYTSKYGLYSRDAIFNEAYYSSDYYLNPDENSSALASTEWVNAFVNTSLQLYSESTNYNSINLLISEYPFEVANIPNYLNNLESLVDSQLTETTKSYICNFGTVTISKYSSYITYYVLAKSILKDGTYSLRIINATYSEGKYKNLSTYLLLPQFNPGYYWSETKNNNIPINPIYIGTTYEDFSVSATKPFMWYTNDGDTWELKDLYILPDSSKLYILSTLRSTFTNTLTGNSYVTPSGFLCYYDEGTVECGYGLNNYVPFNDLTAFNMFDTLLSNAKTGGIPKKEGYLYLWSINLSADKTVSTNWKLESLLDSSKRIELVIENADWGNMSCKPGYSLWEVDSNDVIVGAASSSIYKSGNGTIDKWNDPIWRLSFLREILSTFLYKNESSRYNNITGWNFNYDGDIVCNGFGGLFTARIGGVLAPTSNDSSDSGYKSQSTISYLSGYTIDSGYSINFYFENIKLGLKLNNIAFWAYNALTGLKINKDYKRYFNVSYDHFSVNIKTLTQDTVTSQ